MTRTAQSKINKYLQYQRYDLNFAETEKLGGRVVTNIEAKDSSDSAQITQDAIIERCKTKCSGKFDEDCNIIVYVHSGHKCFLMNCGDEGDKCYFTGIKEGSKDGPVILQRVDKKNQRAEPLSINTDTQFPERVKSADDVADGTEAKSQMTNVVVASDPEDEEEPEPIKLTRQTELLNILIFMKGTVWKSIFGYEADKLE